MKKVSILFTAIAFMAVGVFTSCEEEGSMAPIITFDDASYTVGAGGAITITGEIESEAGLDEVRVFEVNDAGDETQLEVVTSFKGLPITEGADGLTYAFRFDLNVSDGTVQVKIRATDKDDQETSKTVSVTGAAGTALTVAQSTTWERVAANAATGLSMFGLKWTSNLKAVSANIQKDGATKLVELSASDWDIESYEDLVTAVDQASDIGSYNEVSAGANATYNDILATVHNGEYFLIKVVDSEISTSNAGTTILINIEYKEAAE